MPDALIILGFLGIYTPWGRYFDERIVICLREKNNRLCKNEPLTPSPRATEGDHALELAADVIGTVAKKNDGTAYRYGGDEFVILCDGNNEDTIKKICNLIDEELDRCNEKNNLPYKISASCGYAVYDEKKYMSLPDFLETADKHMYKVKAVKKGIGA